MGAKIAGQWSNSYRDHSWLSLTEVASHHWPDDLDAWRDVALPRISQLATSGPDDVRVVFAFD